MADFTIAIDLDARGVRTGATQVKAEMRSIANIDLSRLKGQLQQVADYARNVGSAVSSAGRNLSIFVSAPLAGLALLAARFTSLRERAELSFKVLLRDGEKAKALMKDLTEFADATPFESQEIIDAGRLLVAYGVDAKNVKDILTDLGDTAAAMEVNIVEVGRAFGRLKSGDFGEAFERMRDFGISRELLEAKGLKFDKSGQFLGSVDQAMEAVRAVMREKFGGTMEELSNSVSGKFSTAIDKAKGLLIKLFEPVKPILSQQLTNLIGIIESTVAWFDRASPAARLFVVVLGAIAAAAGPVLIAIGGLITVIAGIVSAIGTIVGAAAAVGGIGTVLLIVIGVVAQLGIVFVLVGAQIAALYLAWQTNFGGIRDLTAKVVGYLKAAWAEAMTRVADITATVTAEVKKFWADNGDDIMNAVGEVSEAIQTAWRSVAAFWETNGGTIRSITNSVWNSVKTIVVGAVRIISNTIKLVAAVINGDWSKAWEATKVILKTAIAAWLSILANVGGALVNAIRIAFNGIWALNSWVVGKAIELGKALVQGLINGIGSLASSVWEKGKSIVSGLIDAMKSVAQTQSPSKVTTDLGQHIGEGLAIGLDNKVERVKRSAKKLADETIKQLKEAAKEFGKLAGASPDRVGRVQRANEFADATQAQQDIIRLRKELGVNQNLSLPGTTAGTMAELKSLQDRKQAADDLAASYQRVYDELQQQLDAFEQRKAAIKASGAIELLNLQEEINLVGVVDEFERQRITNNFDLLRLREQMRSDGFEKWQIEETAEVLRIEQNRRLELQKILDIRKQVAAAGDLGKDLLGELDALQRGNQELTKYEETLRRINTELKDISPQQKQYLLDLAQQVDATREAREAFDEMYGTIRDSLQTIAEQGFGAFFKGVINKFQNFLRDMLAEWLTSQFFKLFSKGGGFGQASAGGSGGGGGIFGQILGGIFGGGAGGNGPGGTPMFNGNNLTGGSGGGFNFGSLFGGRGGNTSLTHEGVHAGGSSGMGLAGGLSLAGAGANMIGGMIGGRVGGFISNIGTGVALGAQIGSIIPGIGTAVGAVVGGAVGFLASLFGGDPKRKRDKNEKLPQLNRGFTDSLAELRKLIADVRTLRVNPDSALSRATELRNQIASGFGVQFESKKYRNQAASLIAQRTREADALMEELRGVAEVARAANERERRILPEFASGVFLDGGLAKRNGMLAGAWTGRDTIPAMLARGEMVLNPYQQQRVKMNAGMDPFRGAGIPGYATGVVVGGQPASQQPVAVSSGDVYVQVQVSQDAAGMWTAQAKSSNGKRVITEVVQEGFSNEKLNTKRRGI